MKVVSINHTPAEHHSAAAELQRDLEARVEEFIRAHPEFPAATMIGVLRVVEHNLLERLP